MPRRTVGTDEAVQILRSGEPLIFDTDTVAGIGVAVGFAKDVSALAKAKGRDGDKPVAWLVSSAQSLSDYGRNVPDYAIKLAQRYWPGAITLVVEASEEVPCAFASKAGTIGLRMPANVRLLSLIEKAGCPLATTSANLAGDSPLASTSDISQDFAPDVAVLATEPGETSPDPQGSASCVIDCTASAPRVLRAGTIPISEIEETVL